MLLIALSLGFVGSIHCVGMCGALAFNVSMVKSKGLWINGVMHALLYNIGRTLTYSLLGIVFGLVGSMLTLTNMQRWSSILLGVFFIIGFIISKTPESIFLQTAIGKKLNLYVYNTLQRVLASTSRTPSLGIGMLNGLLPCGLVYLAISGALMSTSYLGGFLFMMCFGLGTFPLMIVIMLLPTLGHRKMLRGFNRVLPYINLLFGIFLIYRAVAVKLPLQLNFLEAINNPIMCH